MLDLVEEGSTWDEVVQLAKALEEAGVSIINTGIGWHEAHSTIATMVPREALPGDRALDGRGQDSSVTSNRIIRPSWLKRCWRC